MNSKHGTQNYTYFYEKEYIYKNRKRLISYQNFQHKIYFMSPKNK